MLMIIRDYILSSEPVTIKVDSNMQYLTDVEYSQIKTQIEAAKTSKNWPSIDTVNEKLDRALNLLAYAKQRGDSNYAL